MKVLLVCMQYDYGDPSRGHSYEYFNFFLSMQALGYDVTLFDYMGELKTLGKEGMNGKLLRTAAEIRPHVALFSLYTDQFEPETVEQLRQHTRTLCFFHDDTWRVEFSRFWAGHFDFFTTPDVHGVKKYKALGMSNAIDFPFGCNETLYRKIDVEKKYDVSFVGAWHPYREWLINRLRREGITVQAFGNRWPGGIVEHEAMVTIFNKSRINLNMSNSACWDARYLSSSPRALLNLIRSPKSVEQLKARHFEINGCGTFQLSYYFEGLERHYVIGDEIGVYLDPDDLIRKVRYYLGHEAEREAVAASGYQRTLSSHTFKRRFEHVFASMGLTNV